MIAPLLCVLSADALRRGETLGGLVGRERWFYAGAALESALVWGLLLYVASRRHGALRHVAALLFVGGLGLTLGGQSYFWDQYRAYLNLDVSLFAVGLLGSVLNQVRADAHNYLAAMAPWLLIGGAVLFVARRGLRPTRRRARIASGALPFCLLGALAIPVHHRQVQAATPDTLYLSATGGLIASLAGFRSEGDQLRPRARSSLPVARMTPQPNARRNTVLLLLESVRADAACSSHAPACRLTAATNQLLPARYGLEQLRAQSSSTAISLAVLWSGLAPTESRDTLHTWPLIFDYARASGHATAYYTSQNLLFGNSRLWVQNLGVTRRVSATELDPAADLDVGAKEELLAAYVERDLDALPEPFFAIVHFANVHYPYRVEASGPQPFQPAVMSKAESDGPAFRNYYQNAVHQQDAHVARVVRALRRGERGARTVIVLTSDHGEAFREHGQMGHTFSVFDEEVHVPGWVDAPPGTLSEAERHALTSKRHVPTFHADVTPTLLDLMGIWDQRAVDPFRGKLLGTSWLRAPHTEAAMPMTNCAGVWSCAFDNWGIMRGSKKLEARAWDGHFRCWDPLGDPGERRELPLADCGDLHARAKQLFPVPAGQRAR